MKDLYIGCDCREEARELLRKWISNQDQFNYHQHISPSEQDKIIQYLLWENRLQQEMLKNGRDEKEHRGLIKCSNSAHDFMMIDLQYGPDED